MAIGNKKQHGSLARVKQPGKINKTNKNNISPRNYTAFDETTRVHYMNYIFVKSE